MGLAVNPRKLLAAQLRTGKPRDAYVAFGRFTASRRLVPEFVMVGASRAGTTSLFRALSTHPQLLRPTVAKGVRYFDVNAERPFSWYRAHFPVADVARRRTRAAGPPVAFEASGYYMFHPFAIQRLAVALPDVRIVAMVRDPIERAFSAWKHETARGFEWETFETALELEGQRLAGEVERMAQDPSYVSFCHRHHSHRSRGEYVEQLERIFAHFPHERVHVIESEVFFAEPAREYARLLSFLGVRQISPRRFEQHNARPSSSMPADAKRELAEHYRGYDEQLADLLGYRPGWMR
jgi:hypothetical protein